MGSFITRQPNGLICRYSSIVDCPTNWNMTDGEYIAYCMEKARDEARKEIESQMQPFDRVKRDFAPYNMTKKRFNEVLKQMELPAEDAKKQKEANPKIFEMS